MIYKTYPLSFRSVAITKEILKQDLQPIFYLTILLFSPVVIYRKNVDLVTSLLRSLYLRKNSLKVQFLGGDWFGLMRDFLSRLHLVPWVLVLNKAFGFCSALYGYIEYLVVYEGTSLQEKGGAW